MIQLCFNFKNGIDDSVGKAFKNRLRLSFKYNSVNSIANCNTEIDDNLTCQNFVLLSLSSLLCYDSYENSNYQAYFEENMYNGSLLCVGHSCDDMY
jgi:hypothetical protein